MSDTKQLSCTDRANILSLATIYNNIPTKRVNKSSSTYLQTKKAQLLAGSTTKPQSAIVSALQNGPCA
jgi:hypothetical protein